MLHRAMPSREGIIIAGKLKVDPVALHHARWEVRHSQHRLKVGGLGSHVADAMVGYVTTEDESTRAIRSLPE